MRKLFSLTFVLGVLLFVFMFSEPSFAISDDVVISQIQLGNSASARNEFIEIYNNSQSDVEITNWCVYYISSGLVQNKLVCFTPENISTHVFIPSKSYILAVSNEYKTAALPMSGDVYFSATLAGLAGCVRIDDESGNEIDKVGWGESTAELDLVSPSPNGTVMSRKSIEDGILQDTDVNSADFEITDLKAIYEYGSIYEVGDICFNLDGIQSALPDGYVFDEIGECVPPPVDICSNLEGMQTIIPNGYGVDIDGSCQLDICRNLDGIQSILPIGLESDQSGNCVEHDECPNILGIQSETPEKMTKNSNNECVKIILPLQITELFPNAAGSDDGNEFIEIYNQNEESVDLADYQLLVGVDSKRYDFPDGSVIKAGSHMAFYDDDISFNLVNTTSLVRLESKDGLYEFETLTYENPKDGMSWSLIEGVWQYTNQPTPNSVNLKSFIVEADDGEVLSSTDLKPCAEGQYRNPETNRCKSIVALASVLAPCKDGQYRSEETNRCRNIVSDVVDLVPCAEGQERNPATNRCRNITTLASSELVPCKAGQERNPETNRCRNVVSATIPVAQYAPQKTTTGLNNYVLWISLSIVGLAAISYGVWEWRFEISKFIKTFRK